MKYNFLNTGDHVGQSFTMGLLVAVLGLLGIAITNAAPENYDVVLFPKEAISWVEVTAKQVDRTDAQLIDVDERFRRGDAFSWWHQDGPGRTGFTTGFCNFHEGNRSGATVYGLLRIRNEWVAKRMNVPAKELGSPDTPGKRIAAAHDWGVRNGYATAIPSFNQSLEGGIQMFDVACIKIDAPKPVKVIKVPAADLPNGWFQAKHEPGELPSIFRRTDEWLKKSTYTSEYSAAYPTFYVNPDDGIIDALDNSDLFKLMTDNKAKGMAIAIIKENRISSVISVGELEANSNKKIEDDSLFQAASISKPITAIGMFKLMEMNPDKVTLDGDLRSTANGPLKFVIPTRTGLSLPSSFKLTLNNILQHRSGIIGRGRAFPSDNVAPQKFTERRGGGYSGYVNNGTLVPTLNEILAGVSSPPRVEVNSSKVEFTYNPVGSSPIYYSGDAYTILQRLVQDVTGEAFDKWMKSNVLDPIGMESSHFTHEMYVGETRFKDYFDNKRVTSGHDTNGNVISGKRNRYPEHAAAGLYTTAPDLAKAVIMLNTAGMSQGVRVISEANAKALRSGVGLFVGKTVNNNDSYFHSGSNKGYRSQLYGFPELKTGVVVLVNSEIDNLPDQIAKAIMAAYKW